jgi:hypothetical protein
LSWRKARLHRHGALSRWIISSTSTAMIVSGMTAKIAFCAFALHSSAPPLP